MTGSPSGVVTLAIFEGEEDNWIGFRADIDALPIQEEGEKDYKSKIDGMMPVSYTHL